MGDWDERALGHAEDDDETTGPTPEIRKAGAGPARRAGEDVTTGPTPETREADPERTAPRR